MQRPRERRGRGLVARHEERHELVAEVFFGEPVALLVAHVEEHREDVDAPRGAGYAPTVDLSEEGLVGARGLALVAPPRRPRAEVALHRGHQERRPRGGLEQVFEHGADAPARARLVEAEDRAEDHLHGDALHGALHREALAEGPPVDGVVGDRHDVAPVGLHALAVKGREHQLAHAHVLGAVEQDERARAEEGPQRDGHLARVHVVAVGREHLADVLGVRHDDQRRHRGDVQQKGLAVPLAALFEEGERSPQPSPEVNRGRALGPRGERHRSLSYRGRASTRSLAAAAYCNQVTTR